MTEIDVPDWVVAVALAAYKAARGTYEGEVPVDADDMRAALTAALGAWVVPAGYIVEFKDKSTTGKWYVHKRQGEGLIYDPCYTLRQEKPE